jgi:hypothetical protein
MALTGFFDLTAGAAIGGTRKWTHACEALTGEMLRDERCDPVADTAWLRLLI